MSRFSMPSIYVYLWKRNSDLIPLPFPSFWRQCRKKCLNEALLFTGRNITIYIGNIIEECGRWLLFCKLWQLPVVIILFLSVALSLSFSLSVSLSLSLSLSLSMNFFRIILTDIIQFRCLEDVKRHIHVPIILKRNV